MKYLISTFVLLLSVILTSCDENNIGFPNSISFPKEGGKMTLKGEYAVGSVEILDYDGDGNSSVYNGVEPYDSTWVTYQWLTVKFVVNSEEITIIAEPSEVSKKRTLYVYGYDNDFEIKVTQN